MLTVALAGDTMLGRGVAERLSRDPAAPLLAPDVVAAAAEADLFLLNLECCISDRGIPFPEPGKRFFFRAPALAARRLAHMGVDAVTLANNHALDFGEQALLDTLEHLDAAGVQAVGAGADETAARAPLRLRAGGERLRVVAVTDHPASYAATFERAGVAYADLQAFGVPDWLRGWWRRARMRHSCSWRRTGGRTCAPRRWRTSGAPPPSSAAAGASLVAGHSAHASRASPGAILYDLGDFLDDYAVDRCSATTSACSGSSRSTPAALVACRRSRSGSTTARHASPARDEARWIRDRFRAACAALGTDVAEEAGRLVVTW